jgi:hypothetical protein
VIKKHGLHKEVSASPARSLDVSRRVSYPRCPKKYEDLFWASCEDLKEKLAQCRSEQKKAKNEGIILPLHDERCTSFGWLSRRLVAYVCLSVGQEKVLDSQGGSEWDQGVCA